MKNYLTLADNIYAFYQDGEAICQMVDFEQAALRLLKARELSSGNEPWKNPAVMYRASSIPVSPFQEAALDALNQKFKCYLKPQDIVKISQDGSFRGKQLLTKQKSLESIQILADRYVEQKLEPAAPAPDVGIQLE